MALAALTVELREAEKEKAPRRVVRNSAAAQGYGEPREPSSLL